MLATKRPHLLLLDIQLPDMSGIEVAARARSDYPDVAVLVLTAHEEVGYIRTLVRLGVRGYLGKTVTGDALIAAIRSVTRGGTVLVSEGVRAALDADLAPLTEREQEVPQLLAAGRRNREIAVTLCVSVKTAEFHVGHVLEKLGVRSRAEAISIARRQGLARDSQEAGPI